MKSFPEVHSDSLAAVIAESPQEIDASALLAEASAGVVRRAISMLRISEVYNGMSGIGEGDDTGPAFAISVDCKDGYLDFLGCEAVCGRRLLDLIDEACVGRADILRNDFTAPSSALKLTPALEKEAQDFLSFADKSMLLIQQASEEVRELLRSIDPPET